MFEFHGYIDSADYIGAAVHGLDGGQAARQSDSDGVIARPEGVFHPDLGRDRIGGFIDVVHARQGEMNMGVDKAGHHVLSTDIQHLQTSRNWDVLTDPGDFPVLDIANMQSEIQKAGIKIAMLAVPAEHAQEVVDQLVEAGIKAILNYAPVSLSVPNDVKVQHIDPAVHLQSMTYYLD